MKVLIIFASNLKSFLWFKPIKRENYSSCEIFIPFHNTYNIYWLNQIWVWIVKIPFPTDIELDEFISEKSLQFLLFLKTKQQGKNWRVSKINPFKIPTKSNDFYRFFCYLFILKISICQCTRASSTQNIQSTLAKKMRIFDFYCNFFLGQLNLTMLFVLTFKVKNTIQKIDQKIIYSVKAKNTLKI